MSWKRPDVLKRMSIFVDRLPPQNYHTLLDVGTGDGVFAKLLGLKFPQAYLLRSDQAHRSPGSDNFIQHRIEGMPFRRLSFDLIIMAQVLHYVDNRYQQVVINNMLRSLSPNGILVIIEYDTDSSRSWLPFPVSSDKIHRYNTDGKIIDTIFDNDRRRPKYAAYLQLNQ